MSRKDNLRQFKNIVAGDMSLTSITSAVTCIQWLDNIGIQLDATGAPVGVATIQVSANYVQDANGSVQNAGTWATIASASISAASTIYIDLNQLSAPWIRVVYTKTSGTGTLDSIITAKQL